MKVKLTDNKEKLDRLTAQLKENGGYCPCAVIHNEDTKCKCKEFKEQIARGESGECHCGLFIATND